MPQKTFLPAIKDVQQGRRWHLLDADGQVIGRLATRAATFLKGKHKPLFTPSIDCGDFVIVTNAAKVRWTGNKLDQKFYFRHSGYASGAKVIPLKRQMSLDPRKAVYLAIRRMLDSNRFRDKQLRRLKIYVDARHPHAPQLGPGAPGGRYSPGTAGKEVPPLPAAQEPGKNKS